MVDLLNKWLLHFVKPSCIPNPPWKVNLDDSVIFIDPYSMSIGENARKISIELSADQQDIAIKQVRSFFIKGTKKLIAYLLFEHSINESCRFLDPTNSKDASLFEKWVMTIAKEFLRDFSSSDINQLEIESRLLHLNDADSFDWEKCSSQYPILSRLARLAMIIPHGNAEVERVFSMLSDVITKKRKSLHPNTVRALCVCKSYLSMHKLSASTFPMDDELLNLAANAHNAYRKRVKEQAAIVTEKTREEKEKIIMSKLKEEKKNDPILKRLNSESEKMRGR